MSKNNTVIQIGDLGPSQQHANGYLKKKIINNRLHGVLKNISVVNTMFKRRLIDENHLYAASKLWQIKQKADGYKSCVHREQTDGGKMIFHTEEQIHYMDVYKKALKNITPEQKSLIEHVVIYDNSLTNRKLPSSLRRYRMKSFKSALNALSEYFYFS